MKIVGIFLILLSVFWVGIRFFSSEQVSAENVSPKEMASYPQWLQEMVERNPETGAFAKSYKDRENYIGRTIDLSGEYRAGQVPLFLQWDKRWGYDSYGDELIGVAGCGPTCLSMAYVHLTGDTTKNPRVMAEFSYENGYYAPEGTSWSLWTEGAAKLGLNSAEVPLEESSMKNRLDEGQVIVCSMAPGDFTTTGHFILIYGYNATGFQVNDPNRKSNSEKIWSFERLQGQIKCLWALSI
ncbi:MAG: hypothetical protein HFI37_01150 [Lachnospiraceae bacterium]|nr:hypothetical protein [Lachnospiraceae bacterium]